MYQSVLQFWFHEITPAQWWKVDPAFDALIASRFGAVHDQATRGELFSWRAEPRGRLAEIIVLDQFSRNMFRGTPDAFASDALALVLAQEAMALGADVALPMEERVFLYMPFMHSESLVIHEQAVQLYSMAGLEFNLNFELKHKVIIERFGRYPHRNAVLGRVSTAEELLFLQQADSGF